MTPESRREAIGLDLGLADQAMAAARALHELGLHNDALSRLSYGLFHTVTALLLTEGVESSTHKAIPNLLGRHFRASGMITSADLAVIAKTYAYRELADYERTFAATATDFEDAAADLAPLVSKIRAHLAAGGWG